MADGDNDQPHRGIVADPDEIAQNEAELEALLMQLPPDALNRILLQGVQGFAPDLLDELHGLQVPHAVVNGDHEHDDQIPDDSDEDLADNDDPDEEDPDIQFHNAPIINAADLRDDENTDDENSNTSFSNRRSAHKLDDQQPSTSGANDRSDPKLRLDRRRNKINFDQSLPTTHSYLGSDMNEVRGGCMIYEPGEIVHKMPVFPVPHMILMPGQHLPLHSMHPLSVQMFRRILKDHKEFAVVSITHRADQEAAQLAPIGTIAQVLKFKEEDESNLTIIKMQAIGRQSFEVLDTHRQIDGSLLADIRIMSEHIERPPLQNIEPPSWRRHRDLPSTTNVALTSRRFLRPTSRQYCRYSTMHLTGVPWFVLRQVDTTVIVQQLIKELQFWLTFDSRKTEQLASDATMLSYWVATNLPIGDATRLELLKETSTLTRLKLELALMRKWSILLCRTCNGRIGEKTALFSMSIHGPMGTYVNAGGHVHDMFTMLDIYAPGVQVVGAPSQENSWFPGYAWTISQCARCSSHLGWRFSAASDQSLRPRTFWGVARHAIVPSLAPPSPTMNGHVNGVDQQPRQLTEAEAAEKTEREALIRLLRLEE